MRATPYHGYRRRISGFYYEFALELLKNNALAALKQVQGDKLGVMLNLFDKGNARAASDGCDPVSVAKRSVSILPALEAGFHARNPLKRNCTPIYGVFYLFSNYKTQTPFFHSVNRMIV